MSLLMTDSPPAKCPRAGRADAALDFPTSLPSIAVPRRSIEPPSVAASPKQHLRPNVLNDLEPYRRAVLGQRCQKQLWEKYWGQSNGAVTDGVLHLAYSPDGPVEGPSGSPLRSVHPDIVRTEYECVESVLGWMMGECEGSGGALVLTDQPGCGESLPCCVAFFTGTDSCGAQESLGACSTCVPSASNVVCPPSSSTQLAQRSTCTPRADPSSTFRCST